MNDLDQLQDRIAKSFDAAFGPTPLNERISDLLTQATSVGRFRDLIHLKQETGDILSCVLQLCNECGWEPSELVNATLKKIESRTEIYKKLGRRLRVGLLGGAFDPVHLSHVQSARRVLESGVVDEVWLMPCFEHLGGKSMAPAELRLEMCRIACQNVRGVSVFDYEIRHEFRGETYHLVKKLLADNTSQSRVEYYLIIGQDNADTIKTWTNAEGLERLIPFVVLPRKGYESTKPDAWYLRSPHQYIQREDAVLDAHRIETSSSEIKGFIERKDAKALDLLPPGVFDFIQKHGLYMKSKITAPNRKVAVYSSTFDPPSLFHRNEVQALLNCGFDDVIICPACPRRQMGEHEHASPMHRAAITSLAFRDMAHVEVDFTDLSTGIFGSPRDLEGRFANRGEIWHVVSSAMVKGGADSASVVQTRWDEGERLWRNSRFAILHDSNGQDLAVAALPPHHKLIEVPIRPTSTDLRSRVYRGETISDSVNSDVAAYIERHRLFLPNSGPQRAIFKLEKPRLLLVFDEKNPKSVAMAQQYSQYESDSPNLILVLGGDGTMLRSIRDHWRLRIPFIGLNTGHLGFLLNERLSRDLSNIELVSYSLPMLRVDAKKPNGESFWNFAYSDVWLERAEGQAAWLRVDVDGETRVSKIVGDGMLIATASGSSGYSRAMGAIPVPIDTPALTLAGSNIFQPRFWKPMILSENSQIAIASLDLSGKRPVQGFIDGMPLGIVQEISVRRSLIASVELAFTQEFDPSARLLRSLFPPNEWGDNRRE